MVKNFLFKTMLLLCALIVGGSNVWAADATFAPSDFSGQGTSSTGSAISATVDGVTFACDKGYGTTEIRCYSGSKITISSQNTITAISFTFSGGRNGGLNTSYSNLSTTSWEQTLASQARFSEIKVTYTSGGGQTTTYTVTYDANGGTGTMTDSNSPYNAGASVTVLGNTFTRDGYTFDHWNTAADGNGTDYDEDDTFTINANTTLYAQWTANGSSSSEQKITITQNDVTNFTNSYNWYDWSSGGISGRAFAYKNNGIQFNTSKTAYWIYNSVAVPGNITSIKMVKVSNATDRSWTLRLGSEEITTTNGGSDGGSKTVGEAGTTWNVSGNYSYFLLYPDGNTNIASIEITYVPSTTPNISASDVSIEHDATSGSISYTINNEPDPAGTLTAEILQSGTIANLTLGTITSSTVPFTCSANNETTDHTATVRLTYTYNTNETVTKDVIITQAAYVAPAVFTALYEGFDTQSSVGGNDGSFGNASSSALSTYGDWTINKVYPADRCVKVGSSSGGYITTPELTLDAAVTYVLTFKAAPWGTDGTTLTLSSDDAVFGGEISATVGMVAGRWSGYYVELTNGTASTQVTFTPAKRMFLDEVRVMTKAAYEALTASKTVESFGWATYIPDYAVSFATNDAWVVTGITNDLLTLESVTSVPAKTPVLLKGSGAKTINVINTASVAAPASNLLTICNGTYSGYPYVLAKDGQSACFKQWTGDAATLNGRVVLLLDDEVAARSVFMLDDDTATGINDMNRETIANNGCYNLNGQRVENPTKGLYIVNGKKVIIK